MTVIFQDGSGKLFLGGGKENATEEANRPGWEFSLNTWAKTYDGEFDFSSIDGAPSTVLGTA